MSSSALLGHLCYFEDNFNHGLKIGITAYGISRYMQRLIFFFKAWMVVHEFVGINFWLKFFF